MWYDLSRNRTQTEEVDEERDFFRFILCETSLTARASDQSSTMSPEYSAVLSLLQDLFRGLPCQIATKIHLGL